MSQLANLIRQIAEKPAALIFAEVTAVNGVECTLSPASDEPDYEGVGLRASLDGEDTGLICIPKIGSMVLAAIVNEISGDARIIQYTELERIEIKFAEDYYFKLNADKTVELRCDTLRVLQGANGGVPIALNVAQKFNQLENMTNALYNFAISHIHTSGAQGSPTTPALTPPATMLISPVTSAQDLENQDFTH